MRHLKDGVLLDMRSLNSMSFDAEKQQVTVGGGVITDEFVRFLESRGMEVSKSFLHGNRWVLLSNSN
jgi:FAD/FMN-containing dehydrogenase